MAHISSNIWSTMMYLVTTFLSLEYTHTSQVQWGTYAKYLQTVFAMKSPWSSVFWDAINTFFTFYIIPWLLELLVFILFTQMLCFVGELYVGRFLVSFCAILDSLVWSGIEYKEFLAAKSSIPGKASSRHPVNCLNLLKSILGVSCQIGNLPAFVCYILHGKCLKFCRVVL